jgi:hypothetical protein
MEKLYVMGKSYRDAVVCGNSQKEIKEQKQESSKNDSEFLNLMEKVPIALGLTCSSKTVNKKEILQNKVEVKLPAKLVDFLQDKVEENLPENLPVSLQEKLVEKVSNPFSVPTEICSVETEKVPDTGGEKTETTISFHRINENLILTVTGSSIQNFTRRLRFCGLYFQKTSKNTYLIRKGKYAPTDAFILVELVKYLLEENILGDFLWVADLFENFYQSSHIEQKTLIEIQMADLAISDAFKKCSKYLDFQKTLKAEISKMKVQHIDINRCSRFVDESKVDSQVFEKANSKNSSFFGCTHGCVFIPSADQMFQISISIAGIYGGNIYRCYDCLTCYNELPLPPRGRCLKSSEKSDLTNKDFLDGKSFVPFEVEDLTSLLISGQICFVIDEVTHENEVHVIYSLIGFANEDFHLYAEVIFWKVYSVDTKNFKKFVSFDLEGQTVGMNLYESMDESMDDAIENFEKSFFVKHDLKCTKYEELRLSYKFLFSKLNPPRFFESVVNAFIPITK